eukprot:TRINITY_DN1115_c1_g3_i3.p1 TRINITY_DN1115_c1_g3~~TRINITY_DN1115_c1_g3_i3.p1  ORF type:complete len:317 (-),score=65.04 TRINITY_DN1115_c1_g3_i3:91-1041(-)
MADPLYVNINDEVEEEYSPLSSDVLNYVVSDDFENQPYQSEGETSTYSTLSYSNINDDHTFEDTVYGATSDDEDESSISIDLDKVDLSLKWNNDFQRFLSMESSEEKFRNLANLSKDFLYAARVYGKIIISEAFLEDNSKKTIKPIDVGGIAGGQKYICQGILFKFATDVKHKDNWIYGGTSQNDEKAMKAANNELKGLMSYFSCNLEGLHFPLFALIHYRGFCITAMSLLPISKDKTLIYGSHDGGKTVKAENHKFNDLMNRAGKLLGLREHQVGDKMICGPGDIEGHIGNDGKFYVIDFGRVMPPQHPLTCLEG